MTGPFPGFGTVLNVVAVVVGALAGMGVGHLLPKRVHDVVTDSLGLVTLLMAITSALAVQSAELSAAVGTGVPILIVLGSLLIGGMTGSALRIEQRLEGLAGWVQRRVSGPAGQDAEPAGVDSPDGPRSSSPRERFIEGWLTASLLFCVGPLTVLGSLNDGLGRGIDQLVLKSSLDLFAALAFASAFGVGVLMSAVSVLVVQGLLTLVGAGLGSLVSVPAVDALTAVGGLLLIGISLRLLRIREIPVGDLLPALLVAPVLTMVLQRF